MPRIQVTTRSGETQNFDLESSGTLMEALRDLGFEGIEGMCGGCCSCATCHIHVAAAGEGVLPSKSQDEDMLLGGLQSYSEKSRLSCQIPLTDALEGLQISIPAES